MSAVNAIIKWLWSMLLLSIAAAAISLYPVCSRSADLEDGGAKTSSPPPLDKITKEVSRVTGQDPDNEIEGADTGAAGTSEATPAPPLARITEEVSRGTGSDSDSEDEANRAGSVEINVVALLTEDEDGRNLGRTKGVYCDLQAKETYVLSTLDGSRIVVFGPDFFPAVSLGRGRGADSPVSVYVDQEANLYVSQGSHPDHPAKISIYNQAFFPVRHITFEDIPEHEDFQPQSLVVNRSGYMYVTGPNARGVLVLDNEGNFSHWLRPVDMIYNPEGIRGFKEATEQEEETADEEADTEFEIDLSGLPAELLPKSSRRQESPDEEMTSEGYVTLNDIQMDTNGNLYLLSAETGKIYVYNSQEEFLFSFGEKGGSSGKLSRPVSLVIDEMRKAVFVVDNMRHSILIYDMGGRFMYEFGGRGYSPGWFSHPDGICLDSDNHLLVSDHYNNRVQVLDVAFTYKFPLFRVPFVQEGMYQPGPMAGHRQQKKYLAPGGFDPGEQAAVESEQELFRKYGKSIM